MIADYLDQIISNYEQKKGNYPKYIKMTTVCYTKMRGELKKGLPEIKQSWLDFPFNYKGIKIKIDKNIKTIGEIDDKL